LKAQLKALEALQNIDLQIADVLKGGKENPRRLAELEAQLGAARGAVESEKSKLTELERQKKALEEQLTADKDKVKKWEARLTEQRSTREYSALAREIDIAKKQNETTSQEIVELARQAESARDVVAERQAAFQAAETALAGQMGEIRKSMGDIDSRRKALDEKRQQAAQQLPPQLIRRYETVHRRHTLVLAPVQQGSCQGCHMFLPPQQNNELRTHARIDACQSCGRMIYSPDAFAEVEAEAQA
jgi:predicted  nucleic acid-binding Zn-ribbon protein